MIETIEAIRRHVVVGANQQRAFEVFTAEMTSWWPPEHHIGSAPIQEILIEPREGGRWYTRHEDGTETSTGYVSSWEPYGRLVLVWQVGADWKFDPKLLTTIELRFLTEAPDRTRVELEHRDPDAFGPEAERMRQLFEQPGAWQSTLAAYAARVAGE
jgi:Activator of Hsp90 ATPase homolog 1-like protein